MDSNLNYSSIKEKVGEIMVHWYGQDPKKWSLGKCPDPSREGVATCALIPPGQTEGNRRIHEELT